MDFKNDNDVWGLFEDLMCPTDTRLSESHFVQGNGFIGCRGTLEEGWQDTAAATFEGLYLNGVCVQEPMTHLDASLGATTQFEQLLHVPNVKKMQISIGESEEVISHERQLDFRTGIVSRQKLLALPDGKQCLVEFERFVSADNPHLMCFKVECLALSADIIVELKTGCDENYVVNTSVSAIKDQQMSVKNMMRLHSAEQNDDFARFIHEVNGSSEKVATTCIDMVCLPGAETGNLSPQTSYINVPKYIRLEAGKTAVFYRYALFHVHENIDALRQLSQTAVNTLLDEPYVNVKRQHCDAFAQYWETADQVVDLSDSCASQLQQQGLNFGMFHLFQAAGRAGKAGLAVRGISGPAGDGQMSWESDIHCVPYFALTKPDIARQLLLARYHQLPFARARAMDLSYERGAFYPSQTISGEESAVNALRASTQLHVNGAIANAIQHYYRATGDVAFLRDYGAEMLVETARLWDQSGYFNLRLGDKFCIEGVSGPNEHGSLVNNHFYTNYLAKLHLQFAIEVMSLIQETNQKAYLKLCKVLQFDAFELARWQVIADKLCLPLDPELAIHAQDDAFLYKPRWDFEAQSPESKPLAKHVHPTKLNRYQVLAQADVLLAMVLADQDYDKAQKQRNLDYYLAITNHDAELSRLVCSILMCELDRVDEARTFFGRSARIDLDDKLQDSFEGLHCLSMACTWNAVTYGFLGIRLRSDGLYLQPRFPAGWDRISQRIHYQQRVIAINATSTQVKLKLISGEPLTVQLYDQSVKLDVDQPSQMSVAAFVDD